MIDVWGVISNALWILGLSVLLAVWSYASYEASRAGQKVRAKLDELGYALVIDAGLLLFLVGMATTEDRWWARALWIVMALAVTAEGAQRIAKHKRSTDSGGLGEA
jgi:hypothetical membrane protein